MKYKISVIIPTFNAEDYLLEAFESIKNQSMGFE
ncbi:MAG: glycosyltransferase, partial [Methanobrevibacter sp.]|nr:glycosyltransferase [Methanobrevibacter sp.]